MSQADELESLCHGISLCADIARSNFKLRINKLNRISKDGGFLDERMPEVQRLLDAANELLAIASEIDALRKELVANAKVRA